MQVEENRKKSNTILRIKRRVAPLFASRIKRAEAD